MFWRKKKEPEPEPSFRVRIKETVCGNDRYQGRIYRDGDWLEMHMVFGNTHTDVEEKATAFIERVKRRETHYTFVPGEMT